jgi:uncharacterized membrane protein YraQ (UPF0718 family)
MILKEIIRIMEFVARAFLHMAPFFIFSVLLAAAVNQFNMKQQLVEFLKRRSIYAIIFATLIGALSPLCSCGVIPMIFALLQMGIPLAPIMSFWITSPIMSVEAFLLTWGNLGFEMAVVRLVSTIFMGITAGLVTFKMFSSPGTSSSWLKHSLSSDDNTCSCNPESQDNSRARSQLLKAKIRDFLRDVKETSLFLGGWLAIAFVVEALITFYFPSNLIQSLFSSRNILSVLYAALMGIPLYLNNISAIPIVNGLLQAGMGKGAALTFLLAGPVTTIPAMIAVYGLVKRKIFFTFLVLGISLSVICGYVYDVIALL